MIDSDDAADTRYHTLTCALCSSLGLDRAVGPLPMPETGTCDSCGGPWPAPAGTALDAAEARAAEAWKSRNYHVGNALEQRDKTRVELDSMRSTCAELLVQRDEAREEAAHEAEGHRQAIDAWNRDMERAVAQARVAALDEAIAVVEEHCAHRVDREAIIRALRDREP